MVQWSKDDSRYARKLGEYSLRWPRSASDHLKPIVKIRTEVVYGPKVTEWQLSYDSGRADPLPVKFPLLLAQGAEGIAVGLSQDIAHNFNELLQASIAYLKKKILCFVDFQTGGIIDVQITTTACVAEKFVHGLKFRCGTRIPNHYRDSFQYNHVFTDQFYSESQ